MNNWQHVQQIRYRLRSAVWSDDSSPVFGAVVITGRPKDDATIVGSMLPCVLIRVMSGTSDRDEPDLREQRYQLTLIVSGQNDALGESAILGAARSGGEAGRGLLEVEEHIFAQVAALQGDLGVRHYVAASSEADAGVDDALGYVAFRQYTLAARGTSTRFYHPARYFRNSAGTLSWSLPPDRFDRLRMILRYAAGSTAPSSATSGTGITLSSALATSVAGIAGTNSYALFAAYDDYPVTSGGPAWIANGTPTTARNYSASVTLTATI